jgi:hypothetical protein
MERLQILLLTRFQLNTENNTKILYLCLLMLYKVLLKKKSQSQGSTLKHSRLSEGNLKAAIAIYRNYCKSYDTADFYENLLKPVMYNV